jgi:hypothetical protein
MLGLARRWTVFSVDMLPLLSPEVKAAWLSRQPAAPPVMQVLKKLNLMMLLTMTLMNQKNMEKKINGKAPGHGGNPGIGRTVDGNGAVGPTMNEAMGVPQQLRSTHGWKKQ